MNLAIPAPGGSVSLARFGIMSVGASLGYWAYTAYLSGILPDSLEEWSLGPIKGSLVWASASALLGAAAASMLFSRVSK